MSNKSLILNITATFLLLGLFSCNEPTTNNSEELIEKAFLQKLESFKSNKRSDCLNGIMIDAEVLVDSIIAQQLNLDTIDFPRKPIKPNSPELKEIPEKFDLEPIKK